MKVAFVVPWYGEDVMGGAETIARTTAENLRRCGIEVEVFTTCSKQFLSDWTDFYKDGLHEVNGVPVKRFRVDPRDVHLFNEINLKLMNRLPISLAEEQRFIANSINSSSLCEYISRNRSNYVFFFIPYMFGTTYFGSRVCPERSFLIPCLHDEGYAYLRIFKQMFEAVRGIVFLSQPESELAGRIFDLDKTTVSVVGAGIDSDVDFDQARFRRKFNVEDDFILYVGRKDQTKNTPLLIDFFCKYIELRNKRLKLILSGPGDVQLPSRHKDSIINLKSISGQDKHDAYAAALVTCQPSVLESFSLVIMESWVCGTPVLVHDGCKVTRHHCVKSNGGLYFRDFEEFTGCLDFLTENEGARKKMGENGRKYVLDNYAWEKVLQRYAQLLDNFTGERGASLSYGGPTGRHRQTIR